jgi:hypothetical protein
MGLIYGNVQGSITNRGNTIKNVTSTGCGGVTLFGERVDQNNQVVLGPLAAYEFEKPASWEVATGPVSIVGICAHNCMCSLEDMQKNQQKIPPSSTFVRCAVSGDALHFVHKLRARKK